jgi:addiction module RelB/DinJ family antitoxin
MKSKTISFKVDETLKSEFDQLAADLGMPVSAMFSIYMKRAVADNGIPFEVKRDNKTLAQLIEERVPTYPHVLDFSNKNDVEAFFGDEKFPEYNDVGEETLRE